MVSTLAGTFVSGKASILIDLAPRIFALRSASFFLMLGFPELSPQVSIKK
jgi:hypothetical protein